MRLFGEIGQNILGDVLPCGRCLFYAGGGGYFQGVKSFDEFSQKGITLRFSGGDLVVSGEKLRVGKYRGGDLELCGRILSLSFYKKGAQSAARRHGGAVSSASSASSAFSALNAAENGGDKGKERDR